MPSRRGLLAGLVSFVTVPAAAQASGLTPVEARIAINPYPNVHLSMVDGRVRSHIYDDIRGCWIQVQTYPTDPYPNMTEIVEHRERLIASGVCISTRL